MLLLGLCDGILLGLSERLRRLCVETRRVEYLLKLVIWLKSMFWHLIKVLVLMGVIRYWRHLGVYPTSANTTLG